MPNPPIFTPIDWYWIVAGSTTQVYSSKVGDYVPINNAAFLAWKAAGDKTPTPIATEGELGEVLAVHFLRPVPVAVLDSYKDAHAGKLTIEVVAKVLFQIVNEIRALKGEAAITPAQFKNYIKGLM